ncbi:hypothetical protein BDV59DRAFT_198962 [Aspergillus ambiguus]|uniref:SDR family oxidoreductase n=1 Tax=Aspergillus ambiguus TaxID=176160 RepID=UPI003CCDB868
MTEYTVHTKGIYHGLPTFPNQHDMSAIVVGTNGISGKYMVDVLSEAPSRWKKIFSLSRKPPSITLPTQVTHVSIDLLASVETIAAQLRTHGVHADYVFFFAYIQPPPKPGSDNSLWSDADELVRVNTALLSNFLAALATNGTPPKHIVLQLGAKYYGVHLGPTAIPQVESQPRVTLEPNFYYPQEDLLVEFCTAHRASWTTTRPSQIVGAATTVVMNLALPLGIYATVQRHLHQKLVYPADLRAWETPMDLSTARMNAYLAEWAALTPGARDQSFNVCDGSPFTWRLFWPMLAAHFGIEGEGPPDEGAGGDVVWRERRTAYDPPPRGYGGPGVRRYRFLLTEWAKSEPVRRAWREIVEQTGVRWDEVVEDVDAVFGFADNSLGVSYPSYFSMGKARKLGFLGYVDSCESLFQTLREFVDLKLLPPLEG